MFFLKRFTFTGANTLQVARKEKLQGKLLQKLMGLDSQHELQQKQHEGLIPFYSME